MKKRFPYKKGERVFIKTQYGKSGLFLRYTKKGTIIISRFGGLEKTEYPQKMIEPFYSKLRSNS